MVSPPFVPDKSRRGTETARARPAGKAVSSPPEDLALPEIAWLDSSHRATRFFDISGGVVPSSKDWLTGADRRREAARVIHEAAMEVLAEGGLEAFSIDAVATRAGCSRATLYRHVGGKEALLQGVIVEAMRYFADRLEAEAGVDAGPERAARATLIALAEVRDKPLLRDAIAARHAMIVELLSGSEEICALGARMYGTRPEAWPWVLRSVLMLVLWPIPDPADEEAIVRSYLVAGLDDPR
jgi:AcrR family transcriptional regulator